MAGNKTDNGVHEVGTDDILASYQADTPGEIETSYLKNVNKAIYIAEKKKKEQVNPDPVENKKDDTSLIRKGAEINNSAVFQKKS